MQSGLGLVRVVLNGVSLASPASSTPVRCATETWPLISLMSSPDEHVRVINKNLTHVYNSLSAEGLFTRWLKGYSVVGPEGM